MSFRTRLLLAALLVAWVPLVALGLAVRSEGARRLRDSQARRVEARSGEVVSAWRRTMERMDRSLEAFEAFLSDDNRVRAAFRSLPAPDPAVQAATEGFGRAAGMEVAYVLGDGGVIVGASHFPGDVGRTSSRLWASLASGGTMPWLGEVPGPEGGRRVLLMSREVRIAGSPAVLAVGLDPASLGWIEDRDMRLFVVSGGEGALDWSAAAPFAGGVDSGAALPPDGHADVAPTRLLGQEGEARLTLAWWDPVLPGLLASFDRALLGFMAGAALLAALAGPFMARRLARPVDRLGETARRVHLGKLDVSFRGGGGREFDRLSRFLNGMMGRLREGVAQVRDAERRATVGEVARQVNHDVRNGLVPIRNVLAHLEEAHRGGADSLSDAFTQRSTTLSQSIAYLDQLADQYRAVAVHGSKAVTDLNEIVASIASGVPEGHVAVQVVSHPSPGPARVQIDPVSLRRVVDNLVSNARAALAPAGGNIRIETGPSREGTDAGYVVRVIDDGPGIPAEVRERIFEPFFTTKEEGSGLGLAIVRRIVSDVGGRVTVESPEGEGTTVMVFLRGAATGTEGAS